MSEESQPATALALLQERAPASVDLGALAIALDYGPGDDAKARNRAAILVSTSINRAGKTSPWQHVHRVKRGVYVYDEALTAETKTGWQEVARDDSGIIVLRNPDGRLYSARPLDGQT